MAYCVKCGTQLSDGDNFCPKCGSPCGNVSKISKQSIKAQVIKEKKPSKTTSKILLVVILIMAFIGGGWFAWKSLGNDYSLEGLAKASLKYETIGNFHCGRAVVFNKDNKYGYIDKFGNEVIPCKYQVLEEEQMTSNDFHEGIACVYNGEKYGYIDDKGNEITSFIYDSATIFSEGFAVTEKDGEYLIVDSSGKEVKKIEYAPDFIFGSFSNGLIEVYGEDGYGFINTNGELKIPCKYHEEDMGGTSFSEGIAAVFNGDKYGFIDSTGKEITPFIYESAGSFSEGLASVKKDGKWYYIDNRGNIVLDIKDSYPGDFHEGIAVISSEEKWYYIDKTGKVIIDNNYSSAEQFNDGYAVVGKKEGDNTLYGVIDTSGKEIIPCVYEFLYFSEGLSCIEKNDVWGFVDLHGKSTFDIENKEVKQIVQQKINQEKEEERKRIEEENKPANKFNSFISQGYIWESRGHRLFRKNHFSLFFYPQNKTIGKVCLVAFNENYTGYSLRISGVGSYTVSENVVDIEYIWKNANWGNRDKFMFRIEDSGNILRVVGNDNEVYNDGDNCIRKYPSVENPIKNRL